VNLFYQPQIADGILHLDPDESRHAVKVLRKKHGDKLHLTDGKGIFYEATITNPDAHKCAFNINKAEAEPKRNFVIHIAISPTKNADRIEWFIEKSVEFGIDQITLLECDHTERQHIKVERLEKMAISAMKQSLNAKLPLIHPLTSFKNLIISSDESEKYIAHVDSENKSHLKNLVKPGTSYVVLIGPEGDFSDEELALSETRGFKKVSLGPSRLRTETAGVAACHILNLANTP
jgi:16S rRNA (uracil1498-N3)-methyltransferase